MKVVEVQNVLLHQHHSPFDLRVLALIENLQDVVWGFGSFGHWDSSWWSLALLLSCWSDTQWSRSRQPSTLAAWKTMPLHGKKQGSTSYWCSSLISTLDWWFDRVDWPVDPTWSSFKGLHGSQTQIFGAKHLFASSGLLKNIGLRNLIWGTEGMSNC